MDVIIPSLNKLKNEEENIQIVHCGNSGEKNDLDIACTFFFLESVFSLHHL